MSAFATLFDAAKDQFTATFGGTVTYSRGADSVEILAIADKSTFEQMDQSGASITLQTVDFILVQAALVLGGEVTTPRRGDRITRGEMTFEVITVPGQGEYRIDDDAGTFLRAYTKRAKALAAPTPTAEPTPTPTGGA